MNFVNFPKNPLAGDVKSQIKENLKEIETLLKIGDKTYKNFLLPLQELNLKIDLIVSPISHINSVENSEESQKIYSEILPILSDYNSDIYQDERIYKAVKDLVNTDLNIEQQKVIENIIRDFKLSGAELSQKDKNRLKEINSKLAQLSNQFSQNLLDSTNKFEMIITDFEDVKELPKIELEQAKYGDKYRFTLQMPSYLAYMTYGSNREKRELIYKAYVTRAEENSIIIDSILKLKKEKVKILGFETYADLSLSTKMANSRDEVLNFLESLANFSKNQAKEELQEIIKFSKLDDFQSFDLLYYSEKYREKYFAINEEEYLPYFEQQNVLNGLFNFLSKIFKIEFQKVENLELWNDKALTYDILENGKVISRIYLDLESRKSKKGGAWVDDWIPHHVNSQGKEILATGFLVCNFSPSSKDIPSLLKHDDVVTLFHEMGHLIHHSLSYVNEPDISGINGVEWDAVEFPSQFLENFAFEKEILKSFAKHYQTGEVIPDKMVDKLIEAKNFQSALKMVRQLEFALFDFKLYSGNYLGDEVQNLLDSIRKNISPLIPPKYNKFQNGFAHIFAGGYSAGYYSYKWAEVLSADLFYAFVDSNFNQDLTDKYRKYILGQGGTFTMKELYRKVLNRDADFKNLLKLSGIKF
jgi:oligopeptidase A